MKFLSNKFLTNLMLLPLIILLAGTSSAGWIGINSNSQTDQEVSLTRSNWDGVELNFHLSGIATDQMKTKGGVFTQLSLDDEAYKGEIGSPRLPVIRKFVEIPYGAEIEIEILAPVVKDMDLTEAGYGQLIPVQPPIPKLPGAIEKAEFKLNQQVYSQDSFLGGEFARIQDIGFMRGHRLLTLEISPVQYNPAQNSIRFASDLTVRLNFRGTDQNLTLEKARRYSMPVYDALLSDLTVNHGAYRDYVFPPTMPISYLIICDADFVTPLAPFVEWKEQTGYDVTIATTAETGSTTTSIRAFIQDAYMNWPNPPAYVLLAGDTDTIPAYTGEDSGSADDMEYTQLEGAEYYTPDIMLGRYSFRSVTDIENVLAKVLQFEMMTMPSISYFKDSVWLASNDHASMLEATHEWCYDNHVYPFDTVNNTYTPVYERLGGDTADFAFNVNAGRGIVCYSGHGYGDGSGTASVAFVHSDVQALTNVDMYGHVMVFACGTNLHDQTISFGERWILEANKGSVSYWGTSESSYWDEDDMEEREVYRSQNEDADYSLAAMYWKGLIEVYTQGGASAYYFDIYNLMGDPSSLFHTRMPQDVTIDCPEGTTPNEQDFNVTVNVAGMGFENAMVSISMNGNLLGAGYTDGSGVASIHIVPPEPGNAVITVTGRNLMVETKNLMIMAAGCGALVMDRTVYNCDQMINLRLWDSDLNLDPGAIDTAEVEISSDSETTPETVVLTEVEPDSGEFAGSITTSDSISGEGYLLLTHGDMITAHYHDAACEGGTAEVYDYADADCVGPIISNLTVSGVSTDTATISWTTDENSDSVLTWGTTSPPTNVETNAAMTMDHSITLNGLDPCTEYYFKVSSSDIGGNMGEDDNSGAYYMFTTLQLVVFLEANMDTDPGWTYEGQWAWGQPTGSSGDPASGYTGDNVVGYNLAGEYASNLPATYVTSQEFDCSGASDVYLSYWVWLGVESSDYDHATLEVSNDGGTSWNIAWEHTGDTVTPSAWSFSEFDISAWSAGSSNVKLRWSMGPTDSSVTYCGWNIDDVLVSYTAPCNVPLLMYGDHSIDDSAGNNDGQINAGETISLGVTLNNNGLDANNVYGNLSTTNPHVTITTNNANFPNIPQSGSGTSITDYVFDVSPEAVDGEMIPFSLSWFADGASGNVSFTAMIVAPTLTFSSVTVMDPAGDGDSILDPGENAFLVVDLDNTGNGNAMNVAATLSSNYPEYVTINDNTAEFSDIPGGGSGQSMDPHFEVTISNSIPDPTVITFTLDITADGYSTSSGFDCDVTASTFARRFFWSMDYCPGWEAEGQWEHGIPQGTSGDPSSGFTGMNVFGYNLAGAYANNLPETNLTTEALDCSNYTGVEVRFMRWLGVESSSYDHATFQVSNDGTTWNTIWTHSGDSFTDPDWLEMVYDISQYADQQPTVYLRWIMGPTDTSVTYCGWNLDDVSLWAEISGPIPTATPVTPTETPVPTFTPIPTNTPTPATPTATATPFYCINDGDVNHDNDLTPEDSLMSFQMYLEMIANPTEDELCRADCNGSTTITPQDGYCIFMNYLMGACSCADSCDCKEQERPDNHRMLSSSTADGDILVTAAMLDRSSNKLSLIIDLADHQTEIDAFGLKVQFPVDRMSYLGSDAGDMIADWEAFGSNADGDIITVGGFDPWSVLTAETQGTIVTLQFELNSTVNARNILNDVVIFNMKDDVKNYNVLILDQNQELIAQ